MFKKVLHGTVHVKQFVYCRFHQSPFFHLYISNIMFFLFENYVVYVIIQDLM